LVLVELDDALADALAGRFAGGPTSRSSTATSSSVDIAEPDP
jgi:hypothetical protein